MIKSCKTLILRRRENDFKVRVALHTLGVNVEDTGGSVCVCVCMYMCVSVCVCVRESVCQHPSLLLLRPARRAAHYQLPQ